MDIVANRRSKLQHIIDTQFGGVDANFIKKTGINQGELSGLLKKKSFGEKKARNIEKQANLSAGYLDMPIDNDKFSEEKTELLRLYDNISDNLKHALVEQARALYNVSPKNPDERPPLTPPKAPR
ncbi:MAG: hypothetical protein Q7T29_09290 [Gallionella sp.]|nr:hypothetical protein [Gallionella sp.]